MDGKIFTKSPKREIGDTVETVDLTIMAPKIIKEIEIEDPLT